MLSLDFKKGDGLIPVIVQDVQSKEVLMLAYMNEEAYKRTCETRLATYWSRSRQSYWVKGETSGHFQKVKEIRIDCDEDTILLLVEQDGAACHTNHYSCFYRDEEGKELFKKIEMK
ncbi:MAG: phosphoribosyl-AMP cyclohydrolase [Firmicutes bacterium]|nr:phosphoribosyl-AMP cyclohydrolase [Bacillota bacterium]